MDDGYGGEPKDDDDFEANVGEAESDNDADGEGVGEEEEYGPDEQGMQGAPEGDSKDPYGDGSALPKFKMTSHYMTKFEKARIIGTRALQISMSAPVTIELGGKTDPIEIAEMELHAGTIPFIVRRYLPNNAYEDWKIDELNKDCC
eukprot:GHVN01106518.1.p1 GENE.GHVN01106518.1~~GHVN01106518.1.p1  ORF type:complete len:146 (+),score=25.81 GHVN01106518.1:150-587(+)